MIKAIIFDFAGVIGSEGYWLWLAENIPNLEESKGYFLDISQKVDKGDITEEEFRNALAEKSGKSSEVIWPEIFQKIIINHDLLSIIVTLKNNYKIGLLTNFVQEWILEILETHNLRTYFDDIVISSQHKVIKPEPKIFRMMLQNLGIEPEEALFIDDRSTNIEGAIAIGMKAFLYTSNEQLLTDLKTLDIE